MENQTAETVASADSSKPRKTLTLKGRTIIDRAAPLPVKPAPQPGMFKPMHREDPMRRMQAEMDELRSR